MSTETEQAEAPRLPRYALDIAWAASDDEERPNLSGVHVKEGCAEATNGHLAMRVPLVDYEGDDVLIPAALAKEAVRLKAPCEVIVDDNGMHLRTEDGRAVTAPPMPEQASLFPDVHEAVSKAWDGDVLVDVAVSADYLHAMSAYAKRNSDRSPFRMTFYKCDAEQYSAPIRVRISVGEGETAEGVLMPIRI